MTEEDVIALGGRTVSERIVIEQPEMEMELHAHNRRLRICIPPHRPRGQQNRCPQGRKNHEEGCQLEWWQCSRRHSLC